MGAASGVPWLVLAFFVPMVVISLVLLFWQLYTRRREALDGVIPVPRGRQAGVRLGFCLVAEPARKAPNCCKYLGFGYPPLTAP